MKRLSILLVLSLALSFFAAPLYAADTFDLTIPYWKDSLQECLEVLKGNKQ